MRPPLTPRRRDAASPQKAEAFNPGDPVEVLPDEPGLRGAYFAAVVVGPSTKPRGYTVEYDALLESEDSDRKLREAVPARTLRPRPPPHRAPAAREAPEEHAIVDALLGEAWWLGVALGGADVAGKVRVCFPETREVMEFDPSDVRPHLEWVASSWRSHNTMAIPKAIAFAYTKGMKIEVSKLKDSSVVAWFPALVAKILWKNYLLVEYTFPNNDGTAFSEIVDVKHVRPWQPQAWQPQASTIRFCINDDVEAFLGGGWWLGVITDVHPRLKYTFKSEHLVMKTSILRKKSLRLQCDWVDGVWKQKSQSTTPESGPHPLSAALVKKRKTRVDGPPDPVVGLTKKHKSSKLGPSEENNRHDSSSKEIYPEIEKRSLRDAPRPENQNSGQTKPAPQPDPTPAPAQRRKVILKLSLPMNQPAAAPNATVSPPICESDAEKNEAVQNTATTPSPEAETCSKSPAKSPLTPLDVIIEELKGYREQWLKAQSQLDHSVTKAKELEGQVAKLQAASEADAQHLQEMMGKQGSLQQRLELKDKEIEDLKKKLVDSDQQMSCVEAELPRGAVMAASHALGVLKSHLPDLDVGILSKGYACTPAEAQALADQVVRPIVEPFVQRLGLSVSTPSEDET